MADAEVEELKKRIAILEQQNQLLMRSQSQILEYVELAVQDSKYFQENIFYEMRAELQEDGFYMPQIVNGNAVIQKIVQEGCSLARFGDGEFAAIAGRIRHQFQNVEDIGLGERLKEVLHSNDERMLIGIADNYGSLKKYNEQAQREIRCYLNKAVRAEHLSLLSPNKVYYDAYVTRPYVMYEDNMTEAVKERFELLKSVWDGRKCVFIEGKYTRMGVGNDLFDNAASIQRILGPAENAFSSYDRILNCCKLQEKDTLFLLALGPAATVLAYDLCMLGYQAVDIGHVDLEYEWYLKGERRRTIVAGKYNNELSDTQNIDDISIFGEKEAKKYMSQIIEDLS